MQINNEYTNLLSPLTKEEYVSLKSSIQKNGLYKPIIVNRNGKILDGYHRFKACKELGIEPKYDVKYFEDPLLEKRFVIEANLLRRQLNDFQKAELVYPLEEIERELAKQRQLSHLKRGNKFPSSSNELNGKGQARDIVAKKAGLKSTTYYRAKTIIDKAPEKVKERVRKGQISISRAYKSIIKVKSVPKGPYIGKSKVEWTDYGLNIYTGCSHNCCYCYGKLLNRRTKWIENWSDTRKRKIDLKELSGELDKLEPGKLFFCSITDAYQPLNEKLDWARSVLEVLLSKSHIITLILTKSAFVEKDLDFIRDMSQKNRNVKLGFTITCLDDEKNRIYEPNSSSPSERIRVLKKAHNLGIPTFVSVEPWIIDHTNPLKIVEELKGFVDEWIFGVHNYSDTLIEDYQHLIGELHSYLIKNGILFRMKAELGRAFKSNPVLGKQEYILSEEQVVGL